MPSRSKKRRKLDHTPSKKPKDPALLPENSKTLGEKTRYNETETFLAKVPAEVRQMIWQLVLGDRVLHLRTIWPEQPKNSNHVLNPNARCLKLQVCTQSTSIQQRYGIWVKDTQGSCTTSLEVSAQHGHNICGGFPFTGPGLGAIVNSLRQTDDSHSQATLSFRANLALLRSCKSISQEAQHVLWRTSIFSFYHGDHLAFFLRSISMKHQALLQRLHLCIDLSRDPYNAVYWQVLVPKSDMERLRSLSELHVSLRVAGFSTNEADQKRCMEAASRFIDTFSTCTLRQVTIIIDYVDCPEYRLPRGPTLRQRQQWAEQLRQSLLRPEKTTRDTTLGISWVPSSG